MERLRSEELFKRAVEVVPGGIYGHVSPAGGLPNVFPHYAESAEGCRFRDVDGNEWLDFMCGYGAVLLGHRDPEVEEAAEEEETQPLFSLDEQIAHVQALYNATSLPTVVLIDQKGLMTAFVRGVVSQNKLERAIRGHL